jgi:hypothetical protein
VDTQPIIQLLIEKFLVDLARMRNSSEVAATAYLHTYLTARLLERGVEVTTLSDRLFETWREFDESQ